MGLADPAPVCDDPGSEMMTRSALLLTFLFSILLVCAVSAKGLSVQQDKATGKITVHREGIEKPILT